MTKFFLEGLGVKCLEEEKGAVGGEGERSAEGFVEGGLPPSLGMHLTEWPAEPLAGEGDGRVYDEKGDLLPGEGGEGVSV